MVTIVKTARGRLTSRHGEDIGRGFPHVGIDIGHGDATPDDLRLVAPAAGYMTWAPVGSYGRRAIIRHDDGSWSLIAHAERWFYDETYVAQLQDIGVMGNTGTQYVHAHQEYHLPDGTAVDPLAYMTAAAGGDYTPLPEGEDEMSPEEWRQFQVLAGTVNTMAARVANIDAWMSEGGPGVDKGTAKPGTVAARVTNIDRQVTGANGFTSNLVQYVLDIKRKLGL